MKTIKALALATVLALGTTGVVHAQASKPMEKAPAVKVLENDDIATMLDTMGYEYTITESEDKSTRWYNIKINRKELGGTFDVSLALSPNKKKIWSHVHVSEMKPNNLADAEILAKLLEQNAAIGPNHFRLDQKTKALYVSRCTDNRNLTPALVREHIENLVDSCVSTKDTWSQLATVKTTK